MVYKLSVIYKINSKNKILIIKWTLFISNEIKSFVTAPNVGTSVLLIYTIVENMWGPKYLQTRQDAIMHALQLHHACPICI